MGFISKLVNMVKGDQPAAAAAPTGPNIITRDHHDISRRDISDSALKVLYRLKDAGYQGFLVGGGVRDILLGKQPKDFDIATDAHPEQVHKLFRNSILIGRRFRLVHVRFGREIIEVATFRASHLSSDNTNQAKQAENGMLLRDNVYGTIDDDAMRRDFTINAMYYNINGFTIHDFAGGVQDIEKLSIRMIGEPQARYREDPVRMLRAIRFAAKLDFEIDTATAEPIHTLGHLLEPIPAARMFEEVLKMLLSGNGEETYYLLRDYDLFKFLFPATDAAIENDPTGDFQVEEFVVLALRNSDERIAQGKSVTPAHLFAALLWHPLQQRLAQIRNMPPIPAMHQAAQDVILQQVKRTSIPRRFSTPMKEIWDMQLRLPRRHGSRAAELVDNKRFRAAYDFILLREASGEVLDNLGEWWTEYQFASAERREQMTKELGKPAPKKRAKKNQKRAQMVNAYIGLGSNIDQPIVHVKQAIQDLKKLPHSRLMLASKLYQSKPVGPQDQDDFINAVVLLETQLEALALLDALQAIEQQHERVRERHWGPRTLDLDVLLFGEQCIQLPRLTVPHVELGRRPFVIWPLYELSPELVLPDGTKLQDLWQQCHTDGLICLDS